VALNKIFIYNVILFLIQLQCLQSMVQLFHKVVGRDGLVVFCEEYLDFWWRMVGSGWVMWLPFEAFVPL
jgi:hypothetical protein